MEVNLMSDTVTRPSPAMLDAMMKAKVGDDVFGMDPTANALEALASEIFGMEKAMFCPSGTMTNQIAIQMHCPSLSELICEESSHVYQYETGGYAYNARAAVNLIHGAHGKVTADQVEAAIKPNRGWLPRTALVVLENTCNKGGGNFYTLDEVLPIAKICRQAGLKLHLDGARLFNALIETGERPSGWGSIFDSISICLSKGLGAPVGSLLLGSQEFIAEARRYRKVMGGGMRQVGFLAAAGIYALKNNVDRLKDDHVGARKLADALRQKSFVSSIRPVRTNIVVCELDPDVKATALVGLFENQGIHIVAMGNHLIRLVTHLDVTREMIDYTIQVIASMTYD